MSPSSPQKRSATDSSAAAVAKVVFDRVESLKRAGELL